MKFVLPIGALSAALLTAGMAQAAGSDSSPPKTDSVKACPTGYVYDQQTKACVQPRDSRLDDSERFEAARAYAYLGRTDEAFAVLSAMTDQDDDRVLTYMGFTHRKAGNAAEAQEYYRQALDQNPDNLLARSYRAQGWVEEGKLHMARAELTEIRKRGGRGTWAELSLRLAIDAGRGFSY
ncbi:MAG: tetratricopeptide repeat protein [Pseudomonadota bacterium]